MTSAKKIEGLVQDKKIVFESGWLAKQANGAVMIQMGETQVFVAATAGGTRPRKPTTFLIRCSAA